MHKTRHTDGSEVKIETALIHTFERALQCWLEVEYALEGDHTEQGWDGRMHMDLCWGLQDAGRLCMGNSKPILFFPLLPWASLLAFGWRRIPG